MNKRGLNYKSFMAKALLAFLLIPILIFAQGQFFVSHAEPAVRTAKARWSNLQYSSSMGWQPGMQQSVNVSYSGTGTVPADLNDEPSSMDSTITYYKDLFGEGYDLLYVKWDNTGCEAGNATLKFSGEEIKRYRKIEPFTGNQSIIPEWLKNLLDGTNQGTCINQTINGNDITLEFSVPADKVSYILYVASTVDMITYDTTDSVDTVDTAEVNGRIRWGDFTFADTNKWTSGNNHPIDATYSGSGQPIADLKLPGHESDWDKTINLLYGYFNEESDLFYITWDNRGNSAGTASLTFSQSQIGSYVSYVPFTGRGNLLPQDADFESNHSVLAVGPYATCVSQSITDSTVNLVFDVPADCVCYAVYMASRPGPIAVDEGTVSYAVDDDEDTGNSGDNTPKVITDSSVSGKNSYLGDAFNALDNIPEVKTEDKKSDNTVLGSDKKVVQIEGGNNALTTDFFTKLSKLDCVVEYSVIVNDNEYTVIIDSNNIKWLHDEDYYGPEWLISNYPIKGKDGNVLTKGEYLIKDGDTLNKIARELNTTADDLAKKNGIKDKNFIRAGAKLKY